MKNDIFNFQRFGKYFGTDIRTCWANYGLSLMTITILVPVVTYFVCTAFNLILKSSWDGPDTGMRFFIFCVSLICMVVTMPVKCYGKITEKQYGSFWLTLPASRFEKFTSMFLLSCIIVPVVGVVLFLGIDAIICTFDHTCGSSLVANAMKFIRNMGDVQELAMNFVDENIDIEDATLIQQIIDQINSPLLYADELIGMTLPFLLGAVFFKKSKTVKTILVLFAFSTAVSIVSTPIMESWASNVFDSLNDDPAVITRLFDNGFFKNLVVIDTISDTIVNLALMAGVWFRIKTLKH